MYRIATVLLFLILLTQSMYPCGVLEQSKAAAKEIEKSYKKAEKEMSDYYNKEIVPLELSISLLERQIARYIGYIEVLDRTNLILRQKIIKEIDKQSRLNKLIGDTPK